MMSEAACPLMSDPSTLGGGNGEGMQEIHEIYMINAIVSAYPHVLYILYVIQ